MADADSEAPNHELSREERLALIDRVIGLGQTGLGRAEIASALKLSREQLVALEKRYPTFRKAMVRARDEELAWWEKKGREGIESGKLNATLWSKAMSGRFPDEAYGERSGPASGKAEPPKRTRPVTNRDRAKAVALLLAETGVSLNPDAADGAPSPSSKSKS